MMKKLSDIHSGNNAIVVYENILLNTVGYTLQSKLSYSVFTKGLFILI